MPLSVDLLVPFDFRWVFAAAFATCHGSIPAVRTNSILVATSSRTKTINWHSSVQIPPPLIDARPSPMLRLDDYRLTSCISFLKLIQNRLKGISDPGTESPPLCSIMWSDRALVMMNADKSDVGQRMPLVPSSFVDFALQKVEQHASACDHDDIDIHLSARDESTDEQWTQFIEQFYAASQ